MSGMSPQGGLCKDRVKKQNKQKTNKNKQNKRHLIAHKCKKHSRMYHKTNKKDGLHLVWCEHLIEQVDDISGDRVEEVAIVRYHQQRGGPPRQIIL